MSDLFANTRPFQPSAPAPRDESEVYHFLPRNHSRVTSCALRARPRTTRLFENVTCEACVAAEPVRTKRRNAARAVVLLEAENGKRSKKLRSELQHLKSRIAFK